MVKSEITKAVCDDFEDHSVSFRSATIVENITGSFLGTEKRAANRSSMAYTVFSTALSIAHCVASNQSLTMREALCLLSGTSPGTPKIRMSVLTLSE